MKQRTIIITVSPDGNSELEAQGFDDAGCLKETQDLEVLLGKVSGKTKKKECYSTKQTLKVGSK